MTSPLDSLGFDVNKPETLILSSPITGQPIYCNVTGEAAHIEVLSADSDVARNLRRRAQAQVMKRRGKVSVEENEATSLELISALTTGWFLVNFDGEAIDFDYSTQNARELYSNTSFAWIKEQVDEFAGDRSNFMKNSKTS